MQALLSLSRAIDRLNSFVGKHAIWLIFGATAISAINAVIRKVFNYSSNGYLEVQWYLFAWSFLIAAGYTLLKREHVRIDVLNSHFPRKVQLGIEIFGLIFFLTQCASWCCTTSYRSRSRCSTRVKCRATRAG